MSIRYLTARLAQQIDEELMSSAGAFSIDQLMELAGLACAQTLATVYPKTTHPRVLVCCGPGNQGGDGLVAARHLGMFGFRPTIWMPKPGSKQIYKNLHTQCDNMRIPTLSTPASDPAAATRTLREALTETDVVLDAIFGFSFQPPVRAPFDAALPLITASGLPVVSVDIPSGWDVERGNEAGVGLEPQVLVSLTAPKLGAKDFRGRHFLGGRFVSKALEEKYEMNLPPYPGFAQIVEITPGAGKTGEKL
ncbi:YjeF N-terminal domain-like protein [Dentipellis sp. KUC8613]|nr:YjeF N-terminal domain-like protein [Dentipellis sp. KUC8613]